MNINTLYSESPEQLDELIKQAQKSKEEIYYRKIMSPEFKDTLLDWAADNLLGVMTCIAANMKGKSIAGSNSDEDTLTELDSEINEKLLGKVVSNILEWANDDLDINNDLELSFKISSNIWVSVCDAELQPDDEWYCHDDYIIRHEYVFPYILKEIEKNRKSFLMRCLRKYIPETIAFNILAEDMSLLVQKQILKEEEYGVSIIPEKSEELFEYYLQKNNLKKQWEEDLCQS